MMPVDVAVAVDADDGHGEVLVKFGDEVAGTSVMIMLIKMVMIKMVVIALIQSSNLNQKSLNFAEPRNDRRQTVVVIISH